MDQDRIIGRYRILRELGRGGGGTVWLCHDESLGREVALKRVEPAAGDDAGETVRGLREARTAAALSHEGIVAVYDLFEHDGRAWIVMEYVPGQSLAELTREGARLEPDRVARLGAQVAAAVAAAHRAGIVHRDIKPGNVLVTRDWRAKLTDFGIARAQHDEALTRTGLVSGTAAYFSPELAEGADAGPASDVWALGATLYAAVEGRAPHPVRANPLAVLRDIATGPPLAPLHAGALEAVLAGMMQRDPAGRWSAEHSVSALRAVADGGPVTGPPAPWLAVASAGDVNATQAVPRADTLALPRRATGVGSAAAHAGQQDRARGAVGPSREGGRRGAAATAPGSRSRAMPWLVALPLLGLLLLVGWWLMQPEDGTVDPAAATTPGAASSEPATPTSPAATTESSPPATESTTPATESTTSTGESATTTPTPAPATSAELEQAALDYYRTAPRDQDAAWELLLPEAQGDRDAFDERWGDVSRVDLQDLSIDGERATAEVAYRFQGGEEVMRTEALTFARDDDGIVRISALEVTAEEETDPGNDDDDDDGGGGGGGGDDDDDADKGRDDDKDDDDR